jgi:hypothetical protein
MILKNSAMHIYILNIKSYSGIQSIGLDVALFVLQNCWLNSVFLGFMLQQNYRVLVFFGFLTAQLKLQNIQTPFDVKDHLLRAPW